MPNHAISRAAGLTTDQIDHILNQMADSFGQQLRSPIWHSPSEASLDYEECHFSIIGRGSSGRLVHSSAWLQQDHHCQSSDGVQPVRNSRSPRTVEIDLEFERERLRGELRARLQNSA